MNFLSDRLKNLSESETLAMTKLSRELKAKGFDVINLSIGEPDFNTPDDIKEAAKRAIDENYTFYPPVAGFPELRQAISQKFKRENNLDYAPNQIVVSNGAKQSIANVVSSLISPDDEVLIPIPYWVSYREIVKLSRGKCVYIPSSIENNFKVTPSQIESAITPRTKLFMFSSPCNPSGTVYTKDELRQFAEVFRKYEHVFVLSDEIYEHINFNGGHESIAQFDFIKDRVITINGVSKCYAMTGWRIGYMGAPTVIATACENLQSQITSGANSIAQRAVIQALSADHPSIKIMLEAFRKRRDLVLSLLKEIPGIITNVPKGAFYVFTDVKSYYGKSDGKTTIKNDSDLCQYLLNNEYVALVPGTAFGDPNCIRFSYATSNELLIEALKRVKRGLEKLQ